MANATQSTSGARKSGGKPQKRNEATEASATETARGPTQEQIARRAYELFVARGGVHGHAEEDWVQAERELRLGRY